VFGLLMIIFFLKLVFACCLAYALPCRVVARARRQRVFAFVWFN
jgi:hypothetical protein